MTLEKLGAGIDFVQDATPSASDAIDGDVYLDTSLSPPQVKVFDASIGSFIRPQTAQNLDQKVSNAGVNWQTKRANTALFNFDNSVSANTTVTFASVSGSGIVTGINLNIGTNYSNSFLANTEVLVDGTTVFKIDGDTTDTTFSYHDVSGPFGFDSSVEIQGRNARGTSETFDVEGSIIFV
jgi:hypothetical protein